MPKFAKKSVRIVAVSEYTKTDIVKTFLIEPEKIDVIYNAPNLPVILLTETEKNAIREKYTGGKLILFM